MCKLATAEKTTCVCVNQRLRMQLDSHMYMFMNIYSLFHLWILIAIVPTVLNRKQSYDCVVISFVIRLCMQIVLNVFQRVYENAFLMCIPGQKK